MQNRSPSPSCARTRRVGVVTSAWNPQQIPDQTGRTYLITGSNAGLGFFSAEQLAAAGAHVIMTGRSANRLALAKRALIRRVPEASVETLLLDTSNLGSVRAAAASVRSHPALDGLLLNAGIVHPPRTRKTTADRHELVLATNVFGHFALAGELLTMLAASQHGRMVWVGSMATSGWRYDMDDLQLTADYTPWRAYVQSKAAMQALGVEAERRLRDAGVPVLSVLAHPGYSMSGRTERIAGVNQPSLRKRVGGGLQAAFSQSKERGAWPLVRALTDPDVVGGSFWGPGSIVRGTPRQARLPKISRSRAVSERIWEDCEKATGVHWPFAKAARAGRGRWFRR